MKRQKFFVFSVVTIILIAIAFFIAESRAPQTTIEKEILFPELANKINDVTRVEVMSGGGNAVILQKTEDGKWVLQSADNYPAQFDKIKDTVVSLSELRILATKTDNPKLYSELGVEGSENTDSSSLLLTLNDKAGTTLASLIIGKSRKGSPGNSRPNLYVRKVDAKNALLVEGYLQIKSNNNNWFERNVIHIPASRIQHVNIVKNTGGQLTLNKNAEGNTEFEVTEGKTNSPSVLLKKLGTFFEDMNVEGVRAVDNFEFPDEVTTTTFRTFNGLVITAKSILTDDKAFAHFSFTTEATFNGSGDNSSNEKSEDGSETISVEEESQLWNQFLSNWVYEIPEFKFETLDINIGQSPE